LSPLMSLLPDVLSTASTIKHSHVSLLPSSDHFIPLTKTFWSLPSFTK
jgi:hypothetical protein